jgi:hypothetical protein
MMSDALLRGRCEGVDVRDVWCRPHKHGFIPHCRSGPPPPALGATLSELSAIYPWVGWVSGTRSVAGMGRRFDFSTGDGMGQVHQRVWNDLSLLFFLLISVLFHHPPHHTHSKHHGESWKPRHVSTHQLLSPNPHSNGSAEPPSPHRASLNSTRRPSDPHHIR